MSPIETRRVFLDIPLESWKKVPPGKVLYEHDPSSPTNLVRKIILNYPTIPVRLEVVNNDTLEFEIEILVLPGGVVDGIGENQYQTRSYQLKEDEINELGSIGSNIPPIRQQVRWIPED